MEFSITDISKGSYDAETFYLLYLEVIPDMSDLALGGGTFGGQLRHLMVDLHGACHISAPISLEDAPMTQKGDPCYHGKMRKPDRMTVGRQRNKRNCQRK